MGWNSLHLQNNGRLFKDIPEETYVYFVHSFCLLWQKIRRIVKATTQYSTTIHASVEKDNVFACQFHPEKSSRFGLKILENFAKLEKEGRIEMFTKRIIPCLDVNKGRVVKGVNFVDLKDAGDPVRSPKRMMQHQTSWFFWTSQLPVRNGIR